MMAIRLTNSTNSLQGILISDVTSERVARVRRVRDDATTANDLCGLTYQTLLRVFGMKPETLHILMIAALSNEAL